MISKPKSIHRVERVAWRGRDELGWAWEWVEDNLGVRAATAGAKMVEKEKGRGTWGYTGCLVVLWKDFGGSVGSWIGLMDGTG